MRTLTLLVLLVTSQFSHALSASETDCVARSVYHEARSLPKQDWLKVANVAYNRSKAYFKYHFGSRSRNLCDIVKASQYSSSKNLSLPIKEVALFKTIKRTLVISNWRAATRALYFETRKGKMYYSIAWRVPNEVRQSLHINN